MTVTDGKTVRKSDSLVNLDQGRAGAHRMPYAGRVAIPSGAGRLAETESFSAILYGVPERPNLVFNQDDAKFVRTKASPKMPPNRSF